ncbi:MAG: efflux RND transporter periplasmic adaptor subunit, partial [Nitrospinales bacterium]
MRLNRKILAIAGTLAAGVFVMVLISSNDPSLPPSDSSGETSHEERGGNGHQHENGDDGKNEIRHDHEEGEGHGEPSKGPHGGRLFAKDDIRIEITIYEKGVPPQFRVYVSNSRGEPVKLAEVKLTVELHRLDRVDMIHFRPAGEYLLGDKTVEEPHSFDVKALAEWKGQTYRWEYSSVEARAEISEEAAKNAGIAIKTAGPATLKSILTLSGEVGLNEEKIAHITPMLDGVVRGVNANLGDQVKSGQTLALLDSRELADAKSYYLAAKKHYEVAKIGLDRKKIIYENTKRLIELLETGKDLDDISHKLKDLTLGDSRARLIPAYMKSKRSRATYLREKSLFEKKISSESDYLRALEEYRSAEAVYIAMIDTIAHQSSHIFREKQKVAELAALDVDAATQKLLALGLHASEIQALANFGEEMKEPFTRYALKAPIDGRIIEKHITVGEAVKKGGKVFLLADLSNVWVNMTIPAKELKSVKPGQRVTVRSEQLGLESQGILTYMGSIINENTRSITGRAVIPNPRGNWRPGLFVSVELVEDERRVPVAVPAKAIQSMRGWSVVFVKYGDLFEARPLELGETDGQWVEVLSGLAPGQQYVAEHSFTVKAEIGK